MRCAAQLELPALGAPPAALPLTLDGEARGFLVEAGARGVTREAAARAVSSSGAQATGAEAPPRAVRPCRFEVACVLPYAAPPSAGDAPVPCEARTALARATAELLNEAAPGALVVFPAGFLRVGSPDARDALAATMLALSRRSSLALVFGVDVGALGRWAPLGPKAEGFAFACDSGHRLGWPRTTGTLVVGVRGLRVGILAGAEVFAHGLRARLRAARPDLIVVLTHRGPTARWKGVLGVLGGVAPVVLSGEVLGARDEGSLPPWTATPSGLRLVGRGALDGAAVLQLSM